MCITILSTAHPDYPLILISNRDEFINRPTAVAHWWEAPNKHVLGGRDQQRKEQGTWLAITKQGRIAALTNFREEGSEVRKDKSRGGIVNAFLTSSLDKHETPKEFADRLINEVGVHDVGGFTLLFGELKAPDKDGKMPGLSILSNRSASADDLTCIASTAGETHALSNTHFGDKSWPKVLFGEHCLREEISKNVQWKRPRNELIERCFTILSFDSLTKRKGEPWDTYVKEMKGSIFIPPVTRETSEADQNAPAIVDSGSYGTQKQTVILVNRDGKVFFFEKTLFTSDGRPTSGGDRVQQFEFNIENWNS